MNSLISSGFSVLDKQNISQYVHETKNELNELHWSSHPVRWNHLNEFQFIS